MMSATRLLLPFLFVTLAFAQKPSGASTSAEPVLPVVDLNACPFEGCTFGKWKVRKDSTIFSSWKDERTEIATLKAGEDVTGVTGVHITRKPDRILVKQALPELSLRPGDIVLRYMYLGEGVANLWFNGAWHKQQDATFITEKDGEGCLRDCSAIVTEEGIKQWWVEIKTADGKTGWVLVEDNFDGMDSLG